MTEPFGGASFRITRRAPRTFLSALVLLAIVLALGEGAARSAFVRRNLAGPSVGGSHHQIGPKLERLDALVRAKGSPDCIFLGSSMVVRGLDPERIRAVTAQHGGRAVECFNFGLFALNASGAGVMAEILAERYHPRLLVFGTSFRDYVPELGAPVDGPWTDFRSGRFSVAGALIEHSASYRRYLTYRDFGRARYWADWTNRAAFEERVTPEGFWPRTEVERVDGPPDARLYKDMYRALGSFSMDAAERAGLRRVIDLSRRGTRVLVLEMPVPRTCLAMLPKGDADYRTFRHTLEGDAAAAGVPFWATTDLDLVPAQGWADFFHLNGRGAAAFTDWVGPRLAEHLAGLDASR